MLNAVLIGYGYWGPNIARNIHKSPHFNLAGICDISEENLARAQGLYGDKIKYFTSWKEALELPGLDVAALALRNRQSQEVSRGALERGLHLFVEKPMATNMDDAIFLKELAEKNKCLIHVDHLLVYNPFIRRIKYMIDCHELGNIIYFESSRANLGPHIKKDMNAMWDLAVHDLAVLDYLCGGKISKSVKCVGQRKFGSEEVITYLTVKYDDFAAMIKSNWFSPVKERTMIVSGDKKMVVFDDLKESEKLSIYDKGIDLTDAAYATYGALEAKVRMGDVLIPNIGMEDSLLNGLNHFAECVTTGKHSLSDENAAIRVLDILLKADKSLKEE
jgi:predicted dehydrogenase